MNNSATIFDSAYYLPERIETIHDLCVENPEWDEDRLLSKLGIRQRHVAAAGETASDMATSACRVLLERHPDEVEKIDYVLFCTQSPDHYLPSAACVIQHALGLPKQIGALDFNLGCSGYVYGLQLAAALIQSQQANNVLLLTADTYTKYVNPKDRTTRPIFGDAATASLVSSQGERRKIGQFSVGTDGSGCNHIIVPAGGNRMPVSSETELESQDSDGNVRSLNNLQMDGPAVFGFVIANIPRVVKKHLASMELSVEDIDHFVFHQANVYMLEMIAKRLKIPLSKVIIDVADFGNTVSSSIPLAFCRAIENGTIQEGDRVLFVGFGVGLSWAVGSCVA